MMLLQIDEILCINKFMCCEWGQFFVRKDIVSVCLLFTFFTPFLFLSLSCPALGPSALMILIPGLDDLDFKIWMPPKYRGFQSIGFDLQPQTVRKHVEWT
jgi:hypothetical protein